MSKKDEALKLALEALELNNDEWKSLADSGDSGYWKAEDQDHYQQTNKAIAALREALAEQPAQQALDKMAENARELGLDYEPAQQEPVADEVRCPECGYLTKHTEHIGCLRKQLNAINAFEQRNFAIVNMDKFPPAQRTWVGLTDEEIKLVMDGCGEEGDDDYVKPAFDPFGISEDDLMNFARAIEAKLKEKNNG